MTTLTVEGMSCDHCRRAIEEALFAVPGVEKAEVSLAEGRAVVTGDVPVEKLVAAVEQAGYKARLPR